MTIFKTLIILSLALLSPHFGYAQESISDTNKENALTRERKLSSRKGEFSLGLGGGLSYGATIGVRLGINVIDGLNLFGGLGHYVVAPRIGYNIGLLKDFRSSGSTQFYLLGMYGTNGAIEVKGLPEYNKAYAGATFGVGVKINSLKKKAIIGI